MKDGRGFWVGDYWGVDLVRRQRRRRVSNAPKSWKDLLKPEYKNKVALNGSPLSSGSAVAGVFSASIANGGGLGNIGPGIDFFAQLKSVGNFLPVQATPADDRLGSDADHDRLGLPEPRVREELPGREDHDGDPVRRRVRRVLLPGDQRNRPAPVGGAALAGVPLLGPGPAALAEGVLAPGALHRHGRAQGRAEGADQGAAERGRVLEGEVRERGAGDKARATIATEWPKKVGS